MNPLAFNFGSSQQLHTKLQIALAVLPLGLMFASFAPLLFFVPWLESALGIPHGAPVKEQPNGLLWFVIFLVVMLLLMAIGYLFWMGSQCIGHAPISWLVKGKDTPRLPLLRGSCFMAKGWWGRCQCRW